MRRLFTLALLNLPLVFTALCSLLRCWDL